MALTHFILLTMTTLLLLQVEGGCEKEDIRECRTWKSLGFCEKEVYRKKCPHNCGDCSAVEKRAVELVKKDCTDEGKATSIGLCSKAASKGWCKGHNKFTATIQSSCKKTCGLC